MKVPSRPRDSGVRFNITPLIDICFNLIVFFSLASLAARKETTEPILLPRAAKFDASEQAAPRRLIVSVNADRQLSVAGEKVNLIDIDRLVGQTAGDHPAGCEVRVRADQSVPYADVKPLILACARHGIINLKFAVRGP